MEYLNCFTFLFHLKSRISFFFLVVDHLPFGRQRALKFTYFGKALQVAPFFIWDSKFFLKIPTVFVYTEYINLKLEEMKILIPLRYPLHYAYPLTLLLSYLLPYLLSYPVPYVLPLPSSLPSPSPSPLPLPLTYPFHYIMYI